MENNIEESKANFEIYFEQTESKPVPAPPSAGRPAPVPSATACSVTSPLLPQPVDGPKLAKREALGDSAAKRNNGMALTGFVLGIVSVFLYEIGIIPILGIVFSAIGLGTFKPQSQKNRWMAGVGLAASIVYTLMYLFYRRGR